VLLLHRRFPYVVEVYAQFDTGEDIAAMWHGLPLAVASSLWQLSMSQSPADGVSPFVTVTHRFNLVRISKLHNGYRFLRVRVKGF